MGQGGQDRSETDLGTVAQAVSDAFRDEWGQVVATLIRVTGDWDLAEECAQEAFAAALEHWPAEGIPRNPGAWLTTTARHRAIDRLRRQATEKRLLAQLEPPEPAPRDDLLSLIFTCCHPALALESRVALTLRTLTGMTTAQIARAFLVPEATMAKRLTRAKAKIQHAGIPYRVPPRELMPPRLASVFAVLYLLFNEGYTASRESLGAEAIWLARTLVRLMPDEPEASGLLALMLLHHARRSTRVSESGELIPLAEQDRGGWDRELIDEGVALLESAAQSKQPGQYQIQAAIAACHATAAQPSDTDWAQIVALYERLPPTPVIRLNHAVAVAMADGPASALRLVDQIALPDYYLLPATRADLLTRLNRHLEAADAYAKALELAPTEAERKFLSRKLSIARDAARR